MLITLDFLKENGACEDQVQVFQDTFGRDFEVTVDNLRLASSVGLDVLWILRRVDHSVWTPEFCLALIPQDWWAVTIAVGSMDAPELLESTLKCGHIIFDTCKNPHSSEALKAADMYGRFVSYMY